MSNAPQRLAHLDLSGLGLSDEQKQSIIDAFTTIYELGRKDEREKMQREEAEYRARHDRG